jgi:hypothetical protein
VGEWVNLGANTNNSDLKNNYGEVRFYRSRAPMPTATPRARGRRSSEP